MKKIKRNDEVIILNGKDKGKIERVLKIIPKENKAIVNASNMKKNFVKGANRVIEAESPIDISKLKLICTSCKKPTKVKFGKDDISNEKTRICKKCGKQIVDNINYYEEREQKKKLKEEKEKMQKQIEENKVKKQIEEGLNNDLGESKGL